VYDNQWILISGSNKTNGLGVYGEKGIFPGARAAAVGWYDQYSKELWLFGGFGYDSVSVSGGK